MFSSKTASKGSGKKILEKNKPESRKNRIWKTTFLHPIIRHVIKPIFFSNSRLEKGVVSLKKEGRVFFSLSQNFIHQKSKMSLKSLESGRERFFRCPKHAKSRARRKLARGRARARASERARVQTRARAGWRKSRRRQRRLQCLRVRTNVCACAPVSACAHPCLRVRTNICACASISARAHQCLRAHTNVCACAPMSARAHQCLRVLTNV